MRRFEHYHNLAKLKDESEEFQVHALVYTMGEKSDELLASFQLSDADKKKFAVVLKNFDDHFIGKRNVVYERARFGMRNQEEGESIERFVTALHTLSEYCEYEDLRESLVRDRLVLGVKDKQLSEKLMLTKTLDLKRAVQIAQQWEAVKLQHKEITSGGFDTKLDRLQKSNKKGYQKGGNNNQPNANDKCHKCGKKKSHKECPAAKSKCNKCQKTGHWEAVCRSKAVHRVEESEREEEPNKAKGFLGALSKQDASERQTRWTAQVDVDGKPIDFKLDPGADVTVIPYIMYKKLWSKRNLEESDLRLSGPDGSKIEAVGMFATKLQHKAVSVRDDVYVVRGLSQPLLGLRACEDLQLVKRLCQVGGRQNTEVDPTREFPKLFKGLGKIDHPYKIKVKEGARPFATSAPRRVPLPLMNVVKKKLEEMVTEGVIAKVDEPTDWCAPMVIAPKPNGDIRLCVDLTKLNKSVERELHPMPVVEHTLGQLAKAKIFSKLDANSGFYQITLDEESMKLTTFITPFGRFMFKRLPMGITSAPEHFQKRISQILEGIPGVVVHVDDILVNGSTKKEHDTRLREVLKRLQQAGITLCIRKCKFGVPEVTFLGHRLTANGIYPDPGKVEAITKMKAPENVTEVRRITGMVNFVGRFVPRLADVMQPLNELLRDDKEFVWDTPQQAAFQKLKEILTSAPVLALYDPSKETKVSSDASSYGLGAVLLQKSEDGQLKPVAYASRTLSSSEKRYAQIEKEALGITWACERFKDFVTGLHFMVETDHKPLLQILSTKELDDLSPRLQRFRMRLMRYSYDIEYTPGKQLITADALSRHPLPETGDQYQDQEVAAQVNFVLASIPATDEKLAEIIQAQNQDPIVQKLASYSKDGWPDRSKVDSECLKYWSVREDITVQDGLVMRGCRILIPVSMREEMLGRIHSGHMGIVKCRARAREAVWWPGISAQIEEVIKRCPVCIQERNDRHEPLIPSEFPVRPWQKVGMDLFKLEGKWYLVLMDYFSRYPEVTELSNMTAALVINRCKSFFARHGIPEEVRSDCGSQFKELEKSEFQKFAKEYGFIHRTSSPRYPQSNGFAEAAVKTVKTLIKKSQDPYKALLEYRATPLSNGYSPAELLMGRRIRTTLPMNPQRLVPALVDQAALQNKEDSRRGKQKEGYDRRHGVREKQELKKGDAVWVKDLRTWGTVAEKLSSPRSYLVDTPRGQFRRNTIHLTRAFGQNCTMEMDIDYDSPEEVEMQQQDPVSGQEQVRGNYVTRYGRVTRPVQHYNS